MRHLADGNAVCPGAFRPLGLREPPLGAVAGAAGLCAEHSLDAALSDTLARHKPPYPAPRSRQDAGRPPAPEAQGPAPACRRAAHRDHRCGGLDRRASGRGPWGDRAYGCAPLRVRHAHRPPGLGRRPPGLSAQDSDWPAGTHPYRAPGRRTFRLHQAERKRLRPIRRGAFLDLHLPRRLAWRSPATFRGAPTMSSP